LATKGPSKKAGTFGGDTKQLILNLLLEGSKTAGEIADKLKIQKSAIRTHLESLQAEQSVRSYFKIEGLGRPRKVYELTERGRELFPRKYDLILSLILQEIESTQGHEYMKKIIKSIADNMAHDIRDKIKESSSSLEESVRILNSFSNELGFMSSFYKEDEDNSSSTYSIISRNCIVHKIAIKHQDAICHGFHDRIIQKSLDGKVNAKVQLKECLALGDQYSRHIIAINNDADK
jgi:DeoR family transcriptional regulator, suf operon transcriptional repressor